jgi:hypothetical protein
VGPGAGVRVGRSAWSGALIRSKPAAFAAVLTFAFARATAAQGVSAEVLAGAAVADTSTGHPALAVARLDLTSPSVTFGGGWSLSVAGEAGWRPLFSMSGGTPEYRDGPLFGGGFQLARTTARIETAIVGRTGTTRVDAWASFFEGGMRVRWIEPLVELDARVRHDNRFPREGALSRYRDPTGRLVLSASVFPLRRGRFAAGVMFESETALPGGDRLPSGWTVTASARCKLPL